jgi:hypothetical protein
MADKPRIWTMVNLIADQQRDRGASRYQILKMTYRSKHK